MTSTRFVMLLLLVWISLSIELAQSQSFATQNLDSLAKEFNLKLTKLTSPALEERKRIRRALQRNGYSNILMDVVTADGMSAIMSYIKTKLHIEYSISHRPLSVQVPIVGGEGKMWDFPLADDWTFPADPWKKE